MPEALEPQTVVDGDHHDPVAGEGGRVIAGHAGRADLPGAAVQPHHDGQPGGTEVGRPDVQGQAVQAVAGPPELRSPRRHRKLWWRGAESYGVLDPVPWLRRGG